MEIRLVFWIYRLSSVSMDTMLRAGRPEFISQQGQ